MSDKQLRQDEFERDPSLNAAHIGVVVDKNVVSLKGYESYAEKAQDVPWQKAYPNATTHRN